MLTRKGLSREEAYVAVQRNAMKVWEDGGDFKTFLSQDEAIQRLLKPEELNEAFDARAPLKHIDVVYRRVFGES